MSELCISNEEEAWGALLRAGDAHMRFDGWPILFAKIEPGDGQATRKIRDAVDRLEQSIMRTFAVMKCGKPDIRYVTDAERRQLRLSVHIVPACTFIKIDLGSAVEFMVRQWLKKSGRRRSQELALALGLITGATVFHAVLNYHAQVDPAVINAKSQIEAARIEADGRIRAAEIVARTQPLLLAASDPPPAEYTMRKKALRTFVEDVPELRYAAQDVAKWAAKLLKLAPRGGSVTINGVKIPEPSAKFIVRKIQQVPPVLDGWDAETNPEGLPAPKWLTTIKRA